MHFEKAINRVLHQRNNTPASFAEQTYLQNKRVWAEWQSEIREQDSRHFWL